MNKILVIGDVMIDNYLIGTTKRISPEAPVPVVNITSEKSVLGGAGNVVNNLVALDSHVDIISVIGECKNSSLLKEMLKNQGVSNDYLIYENSRPTTTKTRLLASHQQIVRFDNETTKDISKNSEDELLEIYNKIIDNYKVVILSDYGKGVLTTSLTKNLIQIANSKNIKVLVDPKGENWDKYKNSYLLTPNKSEAELALKSNIKTDNLEESITNIKQKYNLDISLITLSEDGIAVYDDKLKTYPTKAREVYDVTGAGDTVIASLAFKISQDKSITEAVEFANLAAGVVVAKTGSATATIDEINNHNTSNIKSWEEIKKVAEFYKSQNKTIVWSNGCFDILHLGHIQYLEKAKSFGDVLIVGVNSDSSVKKLKGDSRPINPEFDRGYLLASLECVDFVVIFDEDTPQKIIELIQPDIVVKGADYKDKTVVGSDIATVKLVDFVDGKSTTKTIEKINQK
jgi:D-beta-D-heptose 7-phosphate kinase/D-beta-D-heptose 1-phosphate adenosyltransferase